MISIVLRNLADRYNIPNFKIHVCLDGMILLNQIEAHIKLKKSVLVLIPIRLGLDSI